jgi:hypothetical protein
MAYRLVCSKICEFTFRKGQLARIINQQLGALTLLLHLSLHYLMGTE